MSNQTIDSSELIKKMRSSQNAEISHLAGANIFIKVGDEGCFIGYDICKFFQYDRRNHRNSWQPSELESIPDHPYAQIKPFNRLVLYHS